MKDVAMMHPQATRFLGNTKDKAKGKGRAKGKKGIKGKPKTMTKTCSLAAKTKSATTTVAKKGFEAFSIRTQQMILFASEQDEAGSARSTPLDTYTEILGLTNAAYVAQHWDWTCCCRQDSAP